MSTKSHDMDALFHDTFDLAPYGIIHVAADGQWIRVNRRVCALLNFSENELQRLSFNELAHPEDDSIGVETFKSLLSSNINRHLDERRLRQRDGQYVWVSISIGESRNPSTGRCSFIVMIEDISGRRMLESQLKLVREAECDQRRVARRLQWLADTIPATICYWNRDLHLEFANSAAQTWFEPITDGVALGKTMQQLLGLPMFQLNEPHVRSVLTGSPQHFQRKRTKADGTVAILEIQYQPHFDESDEVCGFCVLVTDITVMRAARDEALKLAAAKADFLANMSHEIRTPLSGVLGMTEMLLETSLTDEQRELTETALSSGHHLLALVNDILDFSKIESGSLAIEQTGFNLTDLISHVCTIIASGAKEKGLSIEAHVRLDRVDRIGDPMRLRQVLLNLMGNAVKFSSSGIVALEVIPTGEGSDISFSVTDTGIGMSTETLSRLFERFTQADTSTSRRFGGTGLGLAISDRLVALMGGTLRASSEPGRGSRFWFTVPLSIAPAGAQPASAFREGNTAGNLRSLRVLVAEDNAVNQMLAKKMLARLGCEVTVAANGAIAVQAWNSQDFDVVLMDCQMPEMDGAEATKIIRATGAKGAAVPIIALTAGALQSDREQAMLAGMSDFLTKPILERTLEEALNRAVGGVPHAVTDVERLCSSDGQ